MPVKVSETLPALQQLREENIVVLPREGISGGDDKTVRIGLLNLMPLKIMTETDFLRLLSNTPLHVDLELIETSTYRGKNTPAEHLDAHYRRWNELQGKIFDGFIITGAPVENIPFEDVAYWKELTEIMDWCKDNVKSTLYICWGAQAGLYHHYGIDKYQIGHKISGIYPHRRVMDDVPLLRGFDDIFNVPHSRYTEVRKEDIRKEKELKIISESDEAGVHIVVGRNGREIYVTGHSEYSPGTLDYEYRRDMAKGLSPSVPANYYKNNDPSAGIIVSWRSHANLLFSNWLNYYVNQESPYRIH